MNKRLFITIALFFSLMCSAMNAQEKKGDLNNDGALNINDIVILINYLLGQNWNVNSGSADINKDGRVTIADVVALVNLLLETDNMPQVSAACPDSNHPHALDLGLPSGTLWACCNVGAVTPEGKGGYYAWGETEEKSYYDNNTYLHYKNITDYKNVLGDDIAGTKYDVAHELWGGLWQMPSIEQYQELIDNTTSEWTTKNGVNGRTFTGSNGVSLFLPATGLFFQSGVNHFGKVGNYWSSTNCTGATSSRYLWFTDSQLFTSNNQRTVGYPVRPVQQKSIIYTTCPDSHHPHMIDLGLPSGTKWSCCNVGAKSPEDYGGYYAWGETEEKTRYSWESYLYGTEGQPTPLGDDIAGTKYDVAHELWGSPWQMPSSDCFKELIDNTTSVWTTENGINGRKFVGANGGSIFIPVAGYHTDLETVHQSITAFYWSSTPVGPINSEAYCLLFNVSYIKSGNSERPRALGLSVRPISH